MSNRSSLVCAALASAIAPQLRVTGARALPTPIRPDSLIDAAAVIDADGRVFDIEIAEGDAMAKLKERAAASAVMSAAAHEARIDYEVGEVVAQGQTRDELNLPVYITIGRHLEGIPLDFRDLTQEECESLGAAIGRFHALDTGFLTREGHRAYSGTQVRRQLSVWTKGLKNSQSVPDAITSRWTELLGIDAFWQFDPVVCHGSFVPDDVLFSDDSTVTAVRDWEGLSLADPASDFVWLFDEGIQQWQRDEVLAGYGTVLGSRMDPRIVPRARLWRQMTAVRELLEALKAEDHDRLTTARRRVNAIASTLSPVVAVGPGHSVTAVAGSGTGKTVTRAEKASEKHSDEGASPSDASSSTSSANASEPAKPVSHDAETTVTALSDVARTAAENAARAAAQNAAQRAAQSDETHEDAPVQGAIAASQPAGEAASSGSMQISLSQLDGESSISSDSLSFSGTGAGTPVTEKSEKSEQSVQSGPSEGNPEEDSGADREDPSDDDSDDYSRNSDDRSQAAQEDRASQEAPQQAEQQPASTEPHAEPARKAEPAEESRPSSQPEPEPKWEDDLFTKNDGTTAPSEGTPDSAAVPDDEKRDASTESTSKQGDADRFATNTNMPAIEPDGTRITLAQIADTRSEAARNDAPTRPFQTQAYLETDAPDATAHVTHSRSVRERLFPDDEKDFFADESTRAGSDEKDADSPDSSSPADASGQAAQADQSGQSDRHAEER